jgi:hypothetical protein
MAYQTLASIGYSPPIFNDYFIQYSTVTTELMTGGLVSLDPEFNAKASMPGIRTARMPYYNDIDAESNIASDDANSRIVPNTITTGQDMCVLTRRTVSWGSADYIKTVTAGQSDPLRVVISRIGDYWLRERQKTLTSILRGVIASNIANNSGDMVIDISSATAPTARKYHTYIFAPGAIALGFGRPVNPLAYERDEFAGDGAGIEALINRHDYLLHPRGIAWQDAATNLNKTPTNADFANALNWLRVWDRKKIRFCCIISNAKIETNVTQANLLGPDVIIDAMQQLGDHKADLGTMLVHSAVEASLAKLDLIVYLDANGNEVASSVMPLSSQGRSAPIPYYNGRRLIQTDSVYNYV